MPRKVPPPGPNSPLPSSVPFVPTINRPETVRQLRWMVTMLLLVLVFEGLARKMVSSGGTLIFFAKDLICLAIAFRVLHMRRPAATGFLWNAYVAILLLFFPLIFSTALYDPVLAVFGAKQYLLYPIVAIGVYMAYCESTERELLGFYRLMALLLIPTTFLALAQSRLPASHWLNLSVGGDSLSGFSAGGELRVSSSFSFVAQYSLFLNAEMFIIIIALSHLNQINFLWRLLYLSLIPFLVLSSYITGSRGAVVGNMTIIAAACGFTLLRFEGKNTLRIAVIVGLVALSVLLLPVFFPDAFVAYSTRESGHLVGYSSEILDRMSGVLFGWTGQMLDAPFFGNGLGIMSNGSSSFSDYAGRFRNTGMWTETDYSSSLFEGGIYLVVIWYAYRYAVIFQAARAFLVQVRGEFTLPAAFCQGFILITGVTGTMGIQPPVAIWFWFAVGSLFLFATKSSQPKGPSSDDFLPGPPSMEPPRLRGRSVYAERLHAERKT